MEKYKIEKYIDVLITQIIEDSEPLSKSLRKARVVYKETNNKEFERFVVSELAGYKNEDILPDYRASFQTVPIGIYQNKINGQKNEVKLQMEPIFKAANMDPNKANERGLPFSVDEIEHFINSSDTTDITIGFTNGQIAMLKRFSQEDGGWVLIDGYFSFPTSAFQNILSSIKDLFVEYLDKTKDYFTGTVKDNNSGFFENGSPFDAMITFSEIMKTVKKEIFLIDGYIDESTIKMFTFKKPHIKIKILTNPKSINERFELFKDSFNKQYQNLEIGTSKVFHDRFLIIDKKEYYHLGASLKDLGKAVFMYSKINDETISEAIEKKIENEWK